MTLTFRTVVGVKPARILFPGMPTNEDVPGQPWNAPWAGTKTAFADVFKATWVERWGGTRRGHYWACTFGFRLPDHIGLAYEFMRSCAYAYQDFGDKPFEVLGRKLAWTLGHFDIPTPMTTMEGSFVRSIHENPCERVNWMAYADWLVEQDAARAARGQLIQGIFAKKAWPTKYGLPVIPGATRRP